MKHINKGNAPAELKRWFANQKTADGSYLNANYQHLPTGVKGKVFERLLAEQGGLCCYTGVSITVNNAHIEHFKPQAHCHQHEDVDYNNLLAACGNNKQQVSYGAIAKGAWYDEDMLVNPLRLSCESCFEFNRKGEIKPASPHNQAAIETIKQLKLDHPELNELRKAAIQTVLHIKGISAKKCQDIAKSYCMQKNGRYREFCFVVAQVAEQMATRLAGKSTRLKKGKRPNRKNKKS